MLQSVFKLGCLGIAMLGPWGAGALWHYVREPEIYVIFLIGGVLLGLSGLFGFASIERDEAQRHRIARFGREVR